MRIFICLSEMKKDLINKPAHMETLSYIAGGYDYASKIARKSERKQPTISEYLSELEEANLIEVKERTGAKKYKINWRSVLEVFYGWINTVLEGRKWVYEEVGEDNEYKEIREKGIREVIPSNLLKEFLKNYISTLRNLGGRRKGFDELVFSFFAALEHLRTREDSSEATEPKWEELVEKYDLEGELLEKLSYIVNSENWIVELTTIDTMLMSEKNSKKSE